MLISDSAGHAVFSLLESGSLHAVAPGGTVAQPRGLAWADGEKGGGTVVIADTKNHRIAAMDLGGGAAGPWTWLRKECLLSLAGGSMRGYRDCEGEGAMMNGPRGVCLGFLGDDGKGEVYFTDTGNRVVRRLRSVEERVAVETVAGSGEKGSVDASLKSGSFSQPCGLCLDPGNCPSRPHMIGSADPFLSVEIGK